MDNKQLIIIAAGIVVLGLVAIGAAFVVLNDNGSSSATPTPAPAATNAPATGAPTAIPTQPFVPTPGPTGPIIIQANVQVNGTGICFVSMYLNKDASPIDVTHLKMNIECNGNTYSDVMKTIDWDNSNGNSLLEQKEAITTQIDTKALGIPQGRTFTIKVLQDGAVIKETSVTPA
ncbi:MAG TPA: hypothetical protein VGJ92_06525 [Methanocella sp.]|jgi:hypothetical protein